MTPPSPPETDTCLKALLDAQTPVVVFFYGGGWNSGSKDGYLFAARPFVEAGYIVAIPDYRVYPEVRFPSFVEDAAAALRCVGGQIQVTVLRYSVLVCL